MIDPVCTIRDDMLDAGITALTRFQAEGGGSIDEIVTLIFMAMLSQMEGGKVLFAYEGDESPTFRFRQKAVQ